MQQSHQEFTSPFYLLFPYQILKIAYTDAYDPDTQILLQKISQSHCKVIRNKAHITALFEFIQAKQVTHQVVPVSFSSKNYTIISKVYQTINPNIQWTYVGHLKDVCPHQKANGINQIYPNHCRLKKLQTCWYIGYGNTYSQSTIKQQLLMSIKSVYNLTKSIIIEANEGECKKLQKLKFRHVYSELPSIDQLQNIINGKEIQEPEVQEQLSKLIEVSQTLESLMKNTKEKKNRHPLESLECSVTVSLNTKYYKLAHTNSICSQVFRAILGGEQKSIFYGKCKGPLSIGGQLDIQRQQNKVIASALYNIIQSSISNKNKHLCRCLPMWLMKNSIIRHSSIQSYEKEKGCFVVKPFLKNMNSLSELLKNEDINDVFERGCLGKKRIQGMGAIVGLCLITNQKLIQKGLLETLAYYKINGGYAVCRTCFEDLLEYKETDDIDFQQGLLFESNPQVYISLSKLHPQYWQEMKQLLKQMIRIFPLIEALFQYHIWSQNRTHCIKQLKLKIMKLNSVIDQHTKQSEGELEPISFDRIGNLEDIDARWLCYLVENPYKTYEENYEHFVKESQNQFTLTNFDSLGNPNQNQYVVRSRQSSNFLIFCNGNMMPLFTFIKWIKNRVNANKTGDSMSKGSFEVEYISLLKHKANRLEMRSKQAKLDKKNIVLVVDHCELENMEERQSSISQFCCGFKTIFIYRFKRCDNKKLKTLHDSINYKAPLNKSDDEIFRTIFRFSRQSNAFLRYKQAIFLWIFNKCMVYAIDYRQAIQLLKQLVKSVAHQKNRLIHFSTNENKVLLYALPIYISQQRVYLSHDIQQFLQALYLCEAILQNEPIMLCGDQLDCFAQFQECLPSEYREGIEKRLKQKLRNLSYNDNSKLDISHEQYTDTCEILKSMGTKIWCQLKEIIRISSQCLDIKQIMGTGKMVCLNGESKIMEIQPSKGQKTQTNVYSGPEENSLKTRSRNLVFSMLSHTYLTLLALGHASSNTLHYYRYYHQKGSSQLVQVVFPCDYLQNLGQLFQIIEVRLSQRINFYLITSLGLYLVEATQKDGKLQVNSKQDISRVYEANNQEDQLQNCKIVSNSDHAIIVWKTTNSLQLKAFITSKQLVSNMVRIQGPSVRRITCFGINLIEQKGLNITISYLFERSDSLILSRFSLEALRNCSFVEDNRQQQQIVYKVEDNPSCVGVISQQIVVGSSHGFIKRLEVPANQ